MSFFLEEYVKYIIHQADLALTGYAKSLLEPYNLAPEQNFIMLVLWNHKNGISQNEIAELLNKDKTNIARMIVTLENKGLIRRSVNNIDRRSYDVYLTEKGDELRSKIIPITLDANKQIIKGLTKEELDEVKRILMKIMENVK